MKIVYTVSIFLLLALVTVAQAETRASRSEWPYVKGEWPIVWRSDIPLENFAKEMAQMQTQAKEIQNLLQLPPAKKWIEFYVFSSQKAYEDYYEKHLYDEGVDYRRALFWKNSKDVIMVFVYKNKDQRETMIDFRHEATHAFLHSVLSDVPIWLDEGLAEYFERPPAERRDKNPYLPMLKKDIKESEGFFGLFYPMPKITNLEYKEVMQDMGNEEYKDSWAWVHFMLHGPPGGREALVEFLHGYLGGRKPKEKLSKKLKRKMGGDIQERFVEHIKHWR